MSPKKKSICACFAYILALASCGPNLVPIAPISIESSEERTNVDLKAVHDIALSEGYQADSNRIGDYENSFSGPGRVVANYGLSAAPNVGMLVVRTKADVLDIWFMDEHLVQRLSGSSCQKYLLLLRKLQREFGTDRLHADRENCDS